MSKQEIPIACDLSALDDKARHEAIGMDLMAQVQSVTPLDMGYQLELPISALHQTVEFIDGERRCCPFFHFGLQVEPAATRLQLQLTGGDGVKTMLEREILPLLPTLPESNG